MPTAALTLPPLTAIQAERARRSLRYFLERIWPTVEPAFAFVPNWHVDAIAEHLEAVTAGQITDLIVNVPPGTGKSLLVTVAWPCWEWATNPALRHFTASYAAELSIELQGKARDVIKSEWYQRAYPHVRLTEDLQTRIATSAKGWRIATSPHGVGTGKHPDRIIADDPHNVKQAESDAERQTVLNWWDRTIGSRGIIRGVRRVLVMQRLDQRDLTGYLVDKGEAVLLRLPMRKDSVAFSRTFQAKCRPDPIPSRDARQEGDLLWPGVLTESIVKAGELRLGSYGTAGQFQQAPSPPGGAMIKREHFKHYRELPDGIEEYLISIDCTFKDTAGTDYVAAGLFARKGASKYLVDRKKERLTLPGTIALIRSLSTDPRWALALTKLVEDKANGPAVIQTLQGEIDGLIAVEPMGSKVARFAACTPTIEAGNFWIPDPAICPWHEDYVAELLDFPLGAHDDQVDFTSQALNHWNALGNAWARFYAEEARRIDAERQAAEEASKAQPGAA